MVCVNCFKEEPVETGSVEDSFFVSGLCIYLCRCLSIHRIEIAFKGKTHRSLDLKGGIEVILAPDYRAEGRVLAQVMNEILKSVNSLGVQGAEARLLGRAENNRYDGLIFTFKSAEDANRVLRSAVIKREFEWRSGIESKKLLLKVEAVDGNPRALQVLVSEDPANFPHDALYQAKVAI